MEYDVLCSTSMYPGSMSMFIGRQANSEMAESWFMHGGAKIDRPSSSAVPYQDDNPPSGSLRRRCLQVEIITYGNYKKSRTVPRMVNAKVMTAAKINYYNFTHVAPVQSPKCTTG